MSHDVTAEAHGEVRLINIILVERGLCSFVTKARENCSEAVRENEHRNLDFSRGDANCSPHGVALENVQVAFTIGIFFYWITD